MDGPIELLAEADVGWADGRWHARSSAPWLRVPGLERHRGRWVRLRYFAGLFDEHVRPLIRFRNQMGEDLTVPMNGALVGVGEWIGRMPDDTAMVALSPVRRPGAFSFALVAVHPVPRARLLARGLLMSPRLTLTAIGARMIGAKAEARHCLSFAALATPLRGYAEWLARRSRTIDLAGFDRPISDWDRAPRVHLLIRSSGDRAAWDRTHASLLAQSYPRWRLSPIEEQGGEGVDMLDPAIPPAGLGPPEDIIAPIQAGDQFHPHALAHVVDCLTGRPELDACYGDEDDADDRGRPMLPRLKPDPDPIRLGSPDGTGDTLFWRIGAASCVSGELARAVPPHGRLGHVRRLLFRRRARPSPPASPGRSLTLPTVTVVIPTRDRAAHLRLCLAGLFERTIHSGLAVVLVDNGTVEPDALQLLSDAARRPDVRLLRAPGPFNFAALCNAGAALATTRLLLFLNNDVVPAQPNWLHSLAAQAVREEVGAVGARLSYPDGRLQHGGIVIGMGGTALHVHHRAPAGAGYLGQLEATRSVGAVTGAVLMVEREKFEAVGGFDADALPVLLNDVDLCLRLRARGWHAVYEPAATLIHAESASRGRSARPFTVYARERQAFAGRWGDAIRDDPCFHPALSLTSVDPALG